MQSRPTPSKSLSVRWALKLTLVLLLLWAAPAVAQSYIVQPGDTLYGIASTYGVDPEEIAKANSIKDPSIIFVGQNINIPGKEGTPVAVAVATSGESTIYEVKTGDTLIRIANRYGVSVESLARDNNISDPACIYVGQRLQINGGNAPSPTAAPAAQATPPVAGFTYTVRRGDTLNGISQRYDVPVSDIVAANGIRDASSLHVGDQIIIPGRQAESTPSARSGSRFSFTWPAYGEISSYWHEYGPWWRNGYHEGLDIATDWGNPIYAAEAGTVMEAEYGWNNGYGNYVKINHHNGFITLYAHMSELNCQTGQRVEKGDVIGFIGSTGVSTGPHLHFEVRIDNVKVDPLPYLP